jgi:hypothetical protein
MALKHLFNVLIFLNSLSAVAGEVAGSGKALSSSAGPSLPLCVDEGEQIKKIENGVSANRKTKFKYNGYRDALRNDTDVELLTRLAYSETLAANCPELNSKIGPKIVETIGNRVERRKGDVRDIVFERDQFASSLNFYDEAKNKEFLCPKDQKLWGDLYRVAQKRLEAKTVTPSSGINYFLYKHSPKWTKEPWKLAEDPALTTADVRPCVRFFAVPNWK